MTDIDFDKELEHIAFSFVHGGLDPDYRLGGCSCPTCTSIRIRSRQIREKEGNEYYQERYGKQ